jgi:glycosidase
MKKQLLLFALFAGLMSMNVNAAIKVDKIEPADWYVGLKDASLQLLVYGKDVRNAEVTTNYPGVRIDSVARLDSPNYLLVYLNLSGAKSGDMTLKFSQNGSTQNVKYKLKERAMAGDKRYGFSNADALYLLMPDRFAYAPTKQVNTKGMQPYKVDRTAPSLRHGGNLEGIRRHLDYFNQLGVTALWFTPILENDSPDRGGYSTYHGYATTNYYRVDPRFGTNEEYCRLISDAHKQGLKVVMDMIFNHCGFEHPWVKDMPSRDWFNTPEWLQEKGSNGRNPATGFAEGNSAAKSKYLQTSYKLTPVLDPYASQIDKRETVDGWFVPTMPDLNQRNPHVMRYLIQNSIWWIETAGIDGIRMDTYPYADYDAMAQWMKTLDTEYPNFNVVGETWVTEPAYTARFQKSSRLAKHDSYLKTVMDFSFFDKLDKAKHEETDGFWNGLNRIYNSLCYDYLYEDPSHVLAFIENHDTDRFLAGGQDTLLLQQAYALLLTMNRIPQLYYGTEVLMNGTKEVTDGNVRKDFPGGFPGDKHDCFTAAGRTEAENAMFNWVSRLLHWRQNNKLITEGSQVQFIPHGGVYVIARRYGGKTALTILNGTASAATMSVARYAEVIGNHRQATDVLTGSKVALDKDIALSGRQTLILEF